MMASLAYTAALPLVGWRNYGLVPGEVMALNRSMLETCSAQTDEGRWLNELVAAVARDRDRSAFGELFSHFAPRLKSYLMRLGTDGASAEEVVQDVMLTVWRRADAFNPTQAAASTWIFTIARNRRIDRIRQERHPELDPDDPALVPEPAAAADDTIAATQATGRLRAALGTLPDEQAELLRLAYFEDKPHSLISSERGIPLGTVKSRLRLALERLRKALKDE